MTTPLAEIPKRPQVYGLDFDGTITLNPKLWFHFALTAQQQGHVVIIATNRANSPGDRAEVATLNVANCPVVYCDGKPKRQACLEAGYDVDVWADDNPILVDLGLAGLYRFPDRQGWHHKNPEAQAARKRADQDARERDLFAIFAEGRRCGGVTGNKEADDAAILADWRASRTRQDLVKEGHIADA